MIAGRLKFHMIDGELYYSKSDLKVSTLMRFYISSTGLGNEYSVAIL